MTLLLALLAQASLWEPLKLPEAASGKSLRGVAAAGATLWIVGDQGLCLRSDDGGRVWTVQPLGSAATLRSIRFFDEKRGVITGDGDPDAPKPNGHVVMGRLMTSATVFWTLDGGRTWKKAHPPTNFEIPCAEARGGPLQLGNSGGEAHLDGDILRASAALDAWDGKGFKSRRCFRALFDIRALDATRWVAVGSPVSVGFTPPPTEPLYTQQACRALVSRDGGETWAPSKGSDGAGALRGLAAGTSRVLAVGDGGVVLASDDSGESWKALDSGCSQDLSAVASTAQATLAVGDQETTLFSEDGGQGWKRTSTGPGAFLAVAVLGEAFIAVGEPGLARRASIQALRTAKAVEPPAAAPKPEAKELTKAQRERLRPGSTLLYEVALDAAALGIKSRFQREEKIVAVSASSFTVEAKVVKGSPPPGSPAKGSVELPFEGLMDVGAWKVGEALEEKDKTGTRIRTRRPDEKVKVGDREIDCLVLEMKVRSTDGGTTQEQKTWYAIRPEVPGYGIVKDEIRQEQAGPQGRIRVTQVTQLLSWTQPK